MRRGEGKRSFLINNTKEKKNGITQKRKIVTRRQSIFITIETDPVNDYEAFILRCSTIMREQTTEFDFVNIPAPRFLYNQINTR